MVSSRGGGPEARVAPEGDHSGSAGGDHSGFSFRNMVDRVIHPFADRHDSVKEAKAAGQEHVEGVKALGQAHLDELKHSIQELKAAVKVADANVTMIEERGQGDIARAEGEVARLRVQGQDTTAASERLEEVRADAQSSLEEARNQAAAVKAELGELKGERSGYKHDVKDAIHDAKDARNEYVQEARLLATDAGARISHRDAQIQQEQNNRIIEALNGEPVDLPSGVRQSREVPPVPDMGPGLEVVRPGTDQQQPATLEGALTNVAEQLSNRAGERRGLSQGEFMALQQLQQTLNGLLGQLGQTAADPPQEAE